jgi:hypothetical protein
MSLPNAGQNSDTSAEPPDTERQPRISPASLGYWPDVICTERASTAIRFRRFSRSLARDFSKRQQSSASMTDRSEARAARSARIGIPSVKAVVEIYLRAAYMASDLAHASRRLTAPLTGAFSLKSRYQRFYSSLRSIPFGAPHREENER